MRKLMNELKLRWNDRRGITGLETAIVLIAFVVVSSVFAFAALSTGLFSSDKAKETIKAGLDEARGTIELRGSIVAKAIDTTGTGDGVEPTAIDEIALQISGAAGGSSIDLSPGRTIIKYIDANQSINLVSGDFAVIPLGSADTNYLLEPGELYELKITGLVDKLDPDLTADKRFTLEVKPPKGAVLHLERRTPTSFETYNDLS